MITIVQMASLWPLFASFPFLLGTHGQTTDAVCIESYAWVWHRLLNSKKIKALTYSYSKAYNSYGQSPCMVAGYLQQQCNSAPGKSISDFTGYIKIDGDGAVNVPALHQNKLYPAPTSNGSDSSCQCSSVVYSLMSACASCQLGNYVSSVLPFPWIINSHRVYDFRWSAWSSNCTPGYLNV